MIHLRLLVLFFTVLPTLAHAALNVFACEPEWGALATELGGGAVKVYTATTALQDPHHIEARPSLIAQMRRANLVVCTGAELEIGWLPVLLRQSGNAAIQPGQPGYFEATRYVPMREKPAMLDRSQGTSIRAATRISRPILAISRAWRRPWAHVWPRWTRNMLQAINPG